MLEPGTKVIVRSNEDEPFRIGYFERWSEHGIPVVQMDDGNRYLCFGITIPYSEEMAQFLSSMTPQRQWEILAELVQMRDTITSTSSRMREERWRKLRENPECVV
jgi:hypothetical protein